MSEQVCVPREPTQEQLVAGNAMFHDGEVPLNIYRAMVGAAPVLKWRPFIHQRDVPTDGTWFVARSTTPGWKATRVVHYARKDDRLPIDHSGWAWPSEPNEWMPLNEFVSMLPTAAPATTPAPNTSQIGEG